MRCDVDAAILTTCRPNEA